MIIFGSDTGIQSDALGNFWSEITSEFSNVADRFAGFVGNKKPLPKENVYVDDGFMNVPGTSFYGSNIDNLDDVKKRRITTQKPDITVYIKKKLFWSLRNEHDTKFMDSGEKLFIRASKLLFERKCSQIAAYEGMTKLSRLLDEEADMDSSDIHALADYMEGATGDVLENAQQEAAAIQNDPTRFAEIPKIRDAINKIEEDAAKVGEAIEGLRQLAKDARKTKSALTTSWIIDPDKNVDIAKTGRGVGVIELTMSESVNTSLSLEYGDLGNISLSVEDPYNIMKITSGDIELALESAYRETVQISDNTFDTSASANAYLDEARRKDDLLRKTRSNRAFNLGFVQLPTASAVSSDVGEITFEINVSSISEHNVIGRISTSSEPFHKDNYNLIFSQLPVEQRPQTQELNLIREIFDLLDKYIIEIKKISEVSAVDNEDPDFVYARRQMRVFYLGKNIVQPMDGIHIYMRSRTFTDSELLGPLNHLLSGSPFVRSFAVNSEASDAVLQEEMRQFNLDSLGIPLDLYRALRSSSLLRNAGTHIFGGLVSTVNESYNANAGKYMLNISGESNMKWLNLSKVNTAPSLDQPQGVLEDPLTPLDIEVDDATGIILGTPSLSSENKKKLLYYDSGDLKGETLSDENIGQDIVVFGSKAYTKMKHAPGLVYKWKQGIITATRNINLRTRLDGDRSEIAKLRRDVGVRITTDPFANLDIADVVSLLVTGFPHNYESFFINAQSVGSYVVGGNTNEAESYFHSFFDITRSTNRALGNFQPFKVINIDRRQMAKRLSLQTELSQSNDTIKNLQANIATKQDQLNILNTSYQESDPDEQISANRNASIEKLKEQIERLKNTLNDQTKAFTEKIKEGEESGLRVYGDDIILEFTNDTISSETEKKDGATKKLKARSKLTQIRPQLNTKINTDSNLFIVSDDYDKDLDLQAFAISLASSEIPIWNSTYKKPLETCINAAKVIDFEFFCDPMGHLQFRSPKYNKVPLSLLVKMMLLAEKGTSIFPPFLKSLFVSRRQALDETLDIINLEININSLLLFGEELSDDELFGTRSESLDLFNRTIVKPSTTSSDQKDVVNRIRDLRNELASITGTLSSPNTAEEDKKISAEVSELQNPKSKNIYSKRLEKLNKLIQLQSQKERVNETIDKLESRQVKESEVGDLLKDKKSGFGQTLNTGEMANLLEPFGDLIEDDYNDFLGPGSAKRFIIYDDQIISYDFRESDSNLYCRVDVTGQEDLLGGTPGEIGGIPMLWAGATDFDLWKQYGWRAGDSVNKPFFKDAENQCAPYALMLLSRQRRDNVRANITLVGNEYYQLGDVVYINSRDMLYYVYGVRHSFSYSSGAYTTQLDLRYGHPLGEFIPTPLDVIGKNLIKNQRKFNTTFMFRKTAGNDIGRLTGAILFKNIDEMSPDELKEQMLEGDLGVANLIELKNCLLRINSQLNKGIYGVEVRGYITDESDKDKVINRIKAVKQWLEDPISGFGSTTGEPIKLSEDIYPAVPNGVIFDIDADNDPINIAKDQLTKYNKENGRVPREETLNISENAQDAIEVVILFKEPQ